MTDVVVIRGVELRKNGSRFYSHLDLTIKLAETITDARQHGHAQLLVLLSYPVNTGSYDEVEEYFKTCVPAMETMGEKIEVVLEFNDPTHNEVVINFYSDRKRMSDELTA